MVTSGGRVGHKRIPTKLKTVSTVMIVGAEKTVSLHIGRKTMEGRRLVTQGAEKTASPLVAVVVIMAKSQGKRKYVR